MYGQILNMWRLAAEKKRFQFMVGLGLGALLLANTVLVFADDTAGDRYAKILAEADSLARNNEYLSTQLQSQEAQVAQVEQQLADIDVTAVDVIALIQRMFESLEKFVASDLPFLDPTQAGPDSRSERMAKLRELMSNEGASNGERYRRLVEAYQIELEYGRTMVSYKAKLDNGRDADFLRFGRVSLMYRTSDGQEAGYWDVQQKKWIAANEYNKVIEKAVLIATKESAPDLVLLPIPAPQDERL